MKDYDDKLFVYNSLSLEEKQYLCPEGHGYRNVPDENLLFSYIQYDGKLPIGFVEVYRTSIPEEGTVLIAINPAYRGKGYARKLMYKAIEAKYPKEVKTLVYLVDANNKPSINLVNGFNHSMKYNGKYHGRKYYIYKLNVLGDDE